VVVVDHRLGDARGELVGGVGELGPQRKTDRAAAPPSSAASAGSIGRPGQTEPRVELVDLSVGVDARIVLRARSPLKSDVSPVSPCAL